MSKVLKKVPLDFQLEIGKVWAGYVNPYKRQECKNCEGYGWSKDYYLLQDEWFSFEKSEWKPNPFRKDARYNSIALSNNVTQDDVNALIEKGRLWDFTRVPKNDEQKAIVKKKKEDGGNSWLPFDNGYIPTAKEVNEWNLKGIGHDSINCSIVIESRLKKEGKSSLCSQCNGTGEIWESVEKKELYENWVKYDPPTGDGFQLWTSTEGTPITPVFKSLEGLCEYCEKNKISTFGHETVTKQEWKNMLEEGIVYHKKNNFIFI